MTRILMAHSAPARRACWALLLVCTALALSGRGASADTLYGTSIGGTRLFKADTNTAAVTTVVNTLSGADSLVFDTSGRLIYTQIYTGQVRRFDPGNSTDVLLASGLNLPADLALEPGGGTVLVAQYGGGIINRIDLTTLTTTALATGLGNAEGMAYDPSGRLFANVGNRYGGPTAKNVVQLDPVTGAILATSPGMDSVDGLTYDPYSGMLYATSLLGNGFYAVNPSNLGATPTQLAWGQLPMADGITSNGTGSLFIAAAGNEYIYEYNLSTSTLTPKVYVQGLDDLAPASGLGANVVPEPSALALLTAVPAGALLMLRRRGHAAARRAARNRTGLVE